MHSVRKEKERLNGAMNDVKATTTTNSNDDDYCRLHSQYVSHVIFFLVSQSALFSVSFVFHLCESNVFVLQIFFGLNVYRRLTSTFILF